MDRVTVAIETRSGLRASEILADLRSVAETLYYPMKLVGFRDHQQGMHLCPHVERRRPCPHELPESDPAYVDYELTLKTGTAGQICVWTFLTRGSPCT